MFEKRIQQNLKNIEEVKKQTSVETSLIWSLEIQHSYVLDVLLFCLTTILFLFLGFLFEFYGDSLIVGLGCYVAGIISMSLAEINCINFYFWRKAREKRFLKENRINITGV